MRIGNKTVTIALGRAADGLAVSPDHFDAPAVPYTIATPYGPLLEVPLSVAPLLPGLPALIRALPAALRRLFS